jgi:two-component system sensor histidine kinase/response regulator
MPQLCFQISALFGRISRMIPPHICPHYYLHCERNLHVDHLPHSTEINMTSHEDRLTHLQSKRLHVILLRLIAIYSLVFTVKHLIVGEILLAYLTAAALPSTAFGWWLNRSGHYTASKVWNVSSLMVLVFLIGAVVGNNTYFFLLFFPIIIGALIQFQGPHQWIGYLTGGVGFAMMLTLLIYDFHWGPDTVKDIFLIKLERTLNVLAAGLTTALEAIFIMKMSGDMEDRLVRQRDDLNEKNQMLVTNTYTRDRINAVLSHDLRAPLAALEAGLNLLELDQGISEKNTLLIRNLGKRTRETSELLNNLLLWSKQTTQIHKPQIKSIALSELCHYVEAFTLFIGSDKGIEFTFDIGCDPSHCIHADEGMLQTIFRNLISNAIQHTEPGGTISLACHPEGERTHFAVCDTGKGMTAQQVEDILSGKLSTAVSVNHGLGLQLVREFLKNHGSHLDIESTPGKGSRFMFSLN